MFFYKWSVLGERRFQGMGACVISTGVWGGDSRLTGVRIPPRISEIFLTFGSAGSCSEAMSMLGWLFLIVLHLTYRGILNLSYH